MEQFFDQFLYFVQQGIVAIFRFVQFIWTWSVGQIATLLQAPWQEWPPLKRILLAGIIGGVAWILYYAARELWVAGGGLLTAFGTVLGVLIKTLPRVLIAGLVALGGVWLLNNIDLTRLQLPIRLENGANGSDDR